MSNYCCYSFINRKSLSSCLNSNVGEGAENSNELFLFYLNSKTFNLNLKYFKTWTFHLVKHDGVSGGFFRSRANGYHARSHNRGKFIKKLFNSDAKNPHSGSFFSFPMRKNSINHRWNRSTIGNKCNRTASRSEMRYILL